ncbi:hypothetical protein PHISCL_03846 [Aspergillus sclerotialis]|uniref:AB hydrolase-1 domain-containing protein n=1 Tax=Aspergillus sclerotialis TaxID=2070753 RepID=A0A3A3A108_9EURO|nr:hypothetical protein PHISCL_03846 [Aspergillus sclerotialis]
MFQFFKSPFYNFEFIRVLGSSTAQGAEIGECLEAAFSMKAESPGEWFRVWHEMALRVKSLAEKAETMGDYEGARLAFLRCSNYFRASEFFLHTTPQDPRLLDCIEQSVAHFRKAWTFGDHNVETLDIPYVNDTKLPGYLYTPRSVSGSISKPPVIILQSGFDNTQEELYFYLVAGALSRGYAVVTFEGPGQGIVLRRENLHLRPDWENVTGRVLDSLYSTKANHLDLSKTAVAGASMGAYFALRSAVDPRIQACIAIDGFYDLYEVTTSRIPWWFVNLWQAGALPDNIFNNTVALIQRMNFQSDWEINHAMWTFGVESAAAAVREMQRYSLRESDGEEYLSRIRCPVFVTGAADTLYFPPKDNAVKIFANLGQLSAMQKELWIAEGATDGGFQAKIGATGLLHQRVFGWLGKHL